MKLYVGVTNNDWFHFLAARRPDEINFWRPRSQNNFVAIEPGAPFLFKLHHPENFIVGGGFLVRHTLLPISLAWQAFGEKNGVADYLSFESRILEHRNRSELNRNVGCTIIGQPFFFSRDEWIPIPPDWARNIVSGKTYDTDEPIGLALWNEVQIRLSVKAYDIRVEERYGKPQLVQPRLGQGGFRVLVTDAYSRRCAMTGERTLPALEAAHIKPYAVDGPHQIENGVLLRSDLHHLFDQGYITIASDLRVEVSRRIREEFQNGRDYYALHGERLRILPAAVHERPNEMYLEWHRNNRFLA